MAALLTLLDLSLRSMLEVGMVCARKSRFPEAIRPKKECIKSYETYFANTLNLNDKSPSLK